MDVKDEEVRYPGGSDGHRTGLREVNLRSESMVPEAGRREPGNSCASRKISWERDSTF